LHNEIRELDKKIETVYNSSYDTHGSPRVYRELKAQGAVRSENRAPRLMQLRSLRAKQVRRYKSTTKRNEAHPVGHVGPDDERPDGDCLETGHPATSN
jgi:hypothetical protein